ncbi:MAG: nitroreductase/quinone reductase family protein [Ktedonobacterales bacterium]
MTSALEHLSAEEFCYLTTTGRVTGHPHRIEIWFALYGHTLYFLHEGGMADWMKNMVHQPNVTVSFKEEVLTGKGRLIEDHEEDALARQLLSEKYQSSEDDLAEWLKDSVSVAMDLTE